MRRYEVVYIFHPALEPEAIEAKLQRFHAEFAGEGKGGEVHLVEHWGARPLSYAIGGQKLGFYSVVQFSADSAHLPEFERLIKLDEQVLRYLLVLNQGEPADSSSVLAEVRPAAAGRDDEDEEEDEEEEEEDERGGGGDFGGGKGRRRRLEGPPIEILNYKDVNTLSRFVSEQGKLLPRRTTKVNAPFQRALGTAIKRARYLALLPYVRSHG